MIIPGIIASSRPVVSGAYESIATATGTGSSGTITFSSIPSTYQHLQIRMIVKDTDTTAGTYTVPGIIRFNSSTTGYSRHELTGNGSTVSAAGVASTSSMRIAPVPTSPATPTNTNMLGASVVDIHDYASTTKYKTVRAFAGEDMNSATSGTGNANLYSGSWQNLDAVDSITLITGGLYWSSSSVFSLYGIKGA